MGTRNRERRAENRRRRESASTAGNDQPAGLPPIRELIYAAAEILRARDLHRYRQVLAVLVDGGSRASFELEAVVGEALRATVSRNWDAAEVGRQVERRLGPRHARYVNDLGGGAPAHAEPLTVEAVACAVEVLALLFSLPPLPGFGDAARAARRPGQDTRVLEKVRALLAKAESTTFPEEAEALSAKAQELMARHAIDDAMVCAAEGADDAPTGVRLPVDDPYAGAKSVLLSVVASSNRCRAVWSKDLAFSTVVGFDSDLEFVEVLYTSLLVQATAAMVAAGPQVDRYGRSRTRSFRQSFLLAYATRIGDRLRAAETASRVAATEQYGAALVPVLADRSAAVAAARDAAFPGAVSRSVSVSNAAGWAAGSAAADLAALSGRTEVRSSRG